MIFREINGFEVDLELIDGKWKGKVISVGPFWSSPFRNEDGKMKDGMEVEFILGESGSWNISDSSLPWFILRPEKGTLDHYR